MADRMPSSLHHSKLQKTWESVPVSSSVASMPKSERITMVKEVEGLTGRVTIAQEVKIAHHASCALRASREDIARKLEGYEDKEETDWWWELWRSLEGQEIK